MHSMHACVDGSDDSLLRGQQGWDTVMHGGEFYDGARDKLYCYSDVFIYSVDKDTWRQVIIPNRYISALRPVLPPAVTSNVTRMVAARLHVVRIRLSTTKDGSTCGVGN